MSRYLNSVAAFPWNNSKKIFNILIYTIYYIYIYYVCTTYYIYIVYTIYIYIYYTYIVQSELLLIYLGRFHEAFIFFTLLSWKYK